MKGTLEVLNVLATLGFPSVLAVLTFLYRRAFKKQLEFSPALAFAYSYFNNFIAPLHARLAAAEPLEVAGHPVEKVFILIPRVLHDVSSARITTVKHDFERGGNPLEEIVVDTPQGKRTVLVKTERNGATRKLLFDIPRILSTTEQIINDTLGGSREVKKKKWLKREAMEIKNFEAHLTSLIQKHHFEERIKLFDVEVAALGEDADLIRRRSARRSWWQRLKDWFQR